MDNLQPITYSDFSHEGSMYNNFNIFILSGFTGGSPRYDLLGKYNKSTNKFNFSDIVYNPEKHDGYLHIDPDDKPREPRERPAVKSRLSRLGYHLKRVGQIYTKTIHQIGLNIIILIIFK
jgi:hypothetical protein